MNAPSRASNRISSAAFRATSRRGASLVLSVLLLAAITILVGFGRLAMYRNQVKLRLDREREIQQEFATRSVMRWLETCRAGMLPNSTNIFAFESVRGDIETLLIPADPIFPKHGNLGHFDILDERRNDIANYGYVAYASRTQGAPTPGTSIDGKRQTLLLAREGNSGEIRMDLPLTGGTLWTETDYGLRYLVNIEDFARGTAKSASDRLRFAITPFGQAAWDAFGAESPASRAIWFEQYAPAGETRVTLELHAKTPGTPDVLLGTVTERDGDKSKGIQLAGSSVSIIDQGIIGTDRNPNVTRRSEIPLTKDLDKIMGDGFTDAFRDSCKAANGIRLSVQVVASQKPDIADDDRAKNTAISQISVRPAYEYMTELSWPVPRDGKKVSEISTVIRCKGPEPRGVAVQTVTYDTHGTYANRKGHVGNVR